MPYLGNNCILHRARARPEHLLHVNALHSWGGGEESSLFRARDHTGSILNLFVFNQSIYSDVKDVSAPFLPSFRKVIATYFFLALFLFLVFLNCLPLPEGKGALQLLKKVATGFYSERIGKQGRQVSDTKTCNRSQACCRRASCWRHTCAHSTTYTSFNTLAVLFLSAGFFKMMDTNPGVSCCLPLLDTSAFPHTSNPSCCLEK